MAETRTSVHDGKYTVVLRDDGTSTALRYGEPWPVFEGVRQLDNLTVALTRDLETARKQTADTRAMLYLAAGWIDALLQLSGEDPDDLELTIVAKKAGTDEEVASVTKTLTEFRAEVDRMTSED